MRTGINGFLAVAATSVSLLAGGGTGLSARQRGADQAPTFRSGIEVVTVDVGVVDKQGLPLRGLTPADFFVTVGGQPRRVVTAEFVDRQAAQTPAPAWPEPGSVSSNERPGVGRLFAFIVDQSTLDLDGARRVAAAAGPFLSGLTFADRSALMVMPTGPNVAFTWAHNRVRSALQRVIGTGRPMTGWESGSLAEARDIANRNTFTLRSIGERACGSASTPGFGSAPAGAGASPAAGSPAPQGGSATPGGGSGGTGTTPAAPATGGSSGNSRGAGGLGGFRVNGCLLDLQMQAEMTWRMTQMTSLASLSALRLVLGELGRVPGDKTVVLISGGWPMDERDEISLLSTVAAEAAAARATLFTIFVPTSSMSAERRTMSFSPVADAYLHSGPLENLAAMTGGGSFRAEVSAAAAFERITRELAAYYRLGIEKDPADGDDKSRRLKVQVPRSGARVRAREIFDVRTYADRDWTARLASAIDGPMAATDLGLRVTSYLAADSDDGSRLRLLVSGEVSRAQPGEATLHLLVRDLEGKKVAAGDVAIARAGGDTLPFSANIAVPPGRYIVRVGVMDSAGRVGSADHRVDVRGVPLGTLSATGPVLVRVPNDGAGEPRFAVDHVGRDERLALEIGLEGDQERLEKTDVDFEIAAAADGPVLLHAPATLSKGSREGSMLAQAVASMRVLPPGSYMVRARVRSGSDPIGDMRRGFDVVGAARVAGDAGSVSAAVGRSDAPARPAARLPLVAAPSFALDQILSPPVLNVFLDRVAARPDAASPAVRELVERARAAGPGGLVVSESLASETPVAAFLKGLTLLSQNKLEPAASAFRDAMRVSADFYPAMVYLGACYAAAGKDKEAAAVWRTALIREGDAVALHGLLADALLRQGRADLAIDDLDAARARWPEDQWVKRRFVMAALLAGRQIEGLQALDAAITEQIDDEPALALALFMLYQAFDIDEPIESVNRDRERMLRLAERYRASGGPSLALVDIWVAAVARK
jgi:VWFA-related protein